MECDKDVEMIIVDQQIHNYQIQYEQLLECVKKEKEENQNMIISIQSLHQSIYRINSKYIKCRI